MRNLFAALICCFVFASQSAYAQRDPYATELDDLLARPNLNDLIRRVNQPKTTHEARIGLAWLREKSIAGQGGARIHYSYAYGLFSAGVKDTAMLAMVLGSLTARMDAARCADASAPADKIQRWEGNLNPIIQEFHGLDPIIKRQHLEMALKVEASQIGRAPDEWLCRGGVAEMFKSLGSSSGSVTVTPGAPNTILVEPPATPPEYVSKTVWEERRKKIAETFSAAALR